MTDPQQEVAEAARLARRAVDLGRDEAVALSLGGFVLTYVVGDLDDGAAFVERALGLNPNLAIAWAHGGFMKIRFGEHNTAIEHEARAMRLSPLDPFLWAWHFFTARAHFFAGRPEDAASCVEASLRERPNGLGALRLAVASNALREA